MGRGASNFYMNNCSPPLRLLCASMHRKRMFGGILCVLVLIFLAAIPPVAAQDDNEPEIALVSMRARRSIRGAVLVPVEVVVASRGRALDGSLVIEGRDVAINWEVGVALAANTEATQTILVPVSRFSSIALDATLVVEGEEVATGELEIVDSRNGEKNAVGLIGLEPPGPTIDLAPDVGKGALYELANLDLLEGLDSVVVSPAGMRSLGSDEQQVLLNWVSAGHQLIVADRAGSIDELLPVEWQQDGGNVASTGAGFIRYVGSEWQSAVPPGPTVAGNPQMSEFGGVSHNELKSDAGFKVPGIGIIASILGVYMLLAGPVLFALLSARGRQQLAWVLLPALAVAFTVGVVITGNVLTRGRGNGHATIIEVSPFGSTLTDTLLIADSGEQTVSLPVGYTLASSGLGATGGGGAGSPLSLRPSAGADELVFDIDQGSGGTAVVRGQSSDYAHALVVSQVRTSASEITGVVTNATGVDLFNVVAIIGNRATDIGVLASGTEETFSIDLEARARQANPELRIWDVNDPFGGGGNFGGGGGAIDDGPLNGSAWVDWRNTRNGTSAPSGLITVVGWTRATTASLLDGQGRTAFVVHQPVGAISGPAHPDVVRAVPGRAPDPFGFAMEMDFGGFGGEFAETIQYIRPADSDTSNLALRIENFVTALEVWVDDEWRFFELPEQGRVDLTIPDEAWIDDVMWVRGSIEGGFFDPASVPLQLTERDGDAETLTLLPAGETSRRRSIEQFPGEVQLELNETTEVLLDENMFSGEGDIFNSYDEWTIVLAEDDDVTVSMDAFNNGGGLDPYLIIRDPDRVQIAENDDFNGLNSRVQFTARSEGVYVIETRPLSGGGPGGGYEVFIEVEFADPDAPRPTAPASTAVPTATTVEATTTTGGEA